MLFVQKLKWLKTLQTQPYVNTGTWQGQDVSEKPELDAKELYNQIYTTRIPKTVEDMVIKYEPNLPWADKHYAERIGGLPLNPPPSEAEWPFAVKGNEDSKKGKIFSHTYPERFWPAFANSHPNFGLSGVLKFGIRFAYGDFQDVINHLINNPGSRQAYLPIWFPEDTGVVHGERVPCTLGYHFLVRNNEVNVTYFIRSCDLLRHFNDDVYMAARLALTVSEALNCHWKDEFFYPGTLTMHIVNLHVFRADEYQVEEQIKDLTDRERALWAEIQW